MKDFEIYYNVRIYSSLDESINKEFIMKLPFHFNSLLVEKVLSGYTKYKIKVRSVIVFMDPEDAMDFDACKNAIKDTVLYKEHWKSVDEVTLVSSAFSTAKQHDINTIKFTNHIWEGEHYVFFDVHTTLSNIKAAIGSLKDVRLAKSECYYLPGYKLERTSEGVLRLYKHTVNYEKINEKLEK